MRSLSVLFCVLVAALFLLGVPTAALSNQAIMVSSEQNADLNAINVSVNFDDATASMAEFQAIMSQTDENLGTVCVPGKPVLPMVSRFYAVPWGVDVSVAINTGETNVIPAQGQLDLYNEPNVTITDGIFTGERLFPEVMATVSEPAIIRGVRVVKLDIFPVQYDLHNDQLLAHSNIHATLNFTPSADNAREARSIHRHISPEFRKYITAFVDNPEFVLHDFPASDTRPENIGHYLIVANENCVEHIAPFIEWRRKGGYKVDVYSVPDNIARANAAAIKAEIQARYDAYLDQGEEPFDQILLVGDRNFYTYPPAANWILTAEIGESVWREPSHADYKYACLEGDDNYPDVGFARWCAGNPETLGLFVNRTLAYEATPYVADTRWLTRGAVFSQHWGNSINGAWHPSIHTNVRWSEEVLKSKGFDDVRFYEDFEYDQDGRRVGPFVEDQLNDGANFLLGRAENLYLSLNLNGVNDNVVFPLQFVFSGHGEYAAWTMLRTGDAEHLKGPVVSTCGWGDPPTVATSAVWMLLVKGVIQHDMSYGWGHVYSVTAAERYFPNFETYNYPVYLHIKTDNDFYGDPGLMWWNGVPKGVWVAHEVTASPSLTSLDLEINARLNNQPIAGTQVTLYAPGEMPDFDADEYADYDGMNMWTGISDEQGRVRFVFPQDHEFTGDSLYVTLTGRDILPYFSRIAIAQPAAKIDLDVIAYEQVSGNDDDALNPGEVFNITVDAVNLGSRDIEGVTATFASASPYVEIVGENSVSYGDITSGQSAQGDRQIQIALASDCPDGIARSALNPEITVEFASGRETWNSVISLDTVAPHLILTEQPNLVVPTEEEAVALNLTIENTGRLSASEITGELTALGYGIEIVSGSSTFGDVDPEGESGNDESFMVRTADMVVPGSTVEMLLTLSTASGFVDSIVFTVIAGEAGEGAPLGPDDGGYLCLDDGDTDWAEAPQYSWIEISTSERDRDFQGVACNFTGNSPSNIGESQVVDLGFETQFYGQVYSQITINTHGFVAMGAQPRITNFQNWAMDAAIGGGVGMLAPFWDWLNFQEDTQVYYYYDRDQGEFYVEWYKFRHNDGGDRDLTFELVIRDREKWITDTGDQPILFQYRSIENVEGIFDEHTNVPFASVGISSPDGKTGLNYSFKNEYPAAALPLENQRALLFQNGISMPPSDFSLTAPENNSVIDNVEFDFVWEASVDPNPRANLIYHLVVEAAGETQEFLTREPHKSVNIATALYDLDWMKANDTRWMVYAVSGEDTVEATEAFLFRVSEEVGVDRNNSALPTESGLTDVYPNPFNSNVTIQFNLNSAQQISLGVYDLHGRQVQDLTSGAINAGSHQVVWDGMNSPAGLYFVRIQSAEFSQTRKILLVK